MPLDIKYANIMQFDNKYAKNVIEDIAFLY